PENLTHIGRKSKISPDFFQHSFPNAPWPGACRLTPTGFTRLGRQRSIIGPFGHVIASGKADALLIGSVGPHHEYLGTARARRHERDMAPVRAPTGVFVAARSGGKLERILAVGRDGHDVHVVAALVDGRIGDTVAFGRPG